MQPRTFDLGECTVQLVQSGALKLDGGAMFGIIPKVLWSRNTPADELNRIQLACNTLLVQWHSPRACIVVETGHGQKFAAKEQQIYGIDPARWLLPAIEQRGVGADQVTDVIVTHLHFDHAGGLTRRDGDRCLPTFPRAVVHVQQLEHDDARANFGIMTMTYREENFAPLDEAGAWRLHASVRRIFPDAAATPGLLEEIRSGATPGIYGIPAPGHTRGQQAILIHGGAGSILFPGDVLPTRAHAGAAYNMGYDLFPLNNRDTKSRLLRLAADLGWTVVLDHEPNSPIARVQAAGEWFTLQDA